MVIDKAKAVFGDKVSEYPTRQGENIEKGTLKDLQSRHSLRDHKNQHPIPELKLDKALVVVSLPSDGREGVGTWEPIQAARERQSGCGEQTGHVYLRLPRSGRVRAGLVS